MPWWLLGPSVVCRRRSLAAQRHPLGYRHIVTDALPDSVAAAYANAPSPQRETMLEMRARILAILPQASEAMKYGMPTFLHDGVAVIGLLANARHVGVYPYSGSVIAGLPEIAARYGTTKGAIHLPTDAPMPKTLLRALIRARIAAIPEARTAPARARHAPARARLTPVSATWEELGVPGAPARRALAEAGIDTRRRLATWRRSDVAALHGVGPKALAALDALLSEAGLAWQR